MPEWFQTIWSIVQQAGAASAMLMALAITWLLRDRERLLGEIVQRDKLILDLHAAQLSDARTLIPLVQRSTDVTERVIDTLTKRGGSA